ncbi:hypothetical protein [Marinobacter zhanjiangensis]|uniref:Uncharacterized protein n=1 Tax=Marinobacter zhanjiangensis TaxID=578215 RepID=A0ABQ3AM84_9GAMM|nr:hypothetical protein [Marinobacter zhanjiangensis]GGY60731.1 hypothetical protein GCM10007071_04310 [Marinobacter zhanjiangensis]
MKKPEFLYHGSRQRMDVLKPSQGVGYGKEDDRYGIYAVSEWALAIPFAIAYRPLAENATFFVDTATLPPRILLKNTDVEWDETGYLYTVRSDLFEQVDSDQWISTDLVEPVSMEEIRPEDYRSWIEYIAEN